MRRYFIVSLLLLLALPALAQDGSINEPTADDVNEIAGKMYCPVCENIPLDVCGTAACADWRDEIAIMLGDGLTEDEIIDDFVFRFGDRVVGVPQNTTLRVLSLAVPLLAVLALVFALFRFGFNRDRSNGHVLDRAGDDLPTLDELRAQIEHDVKGA